MSKRKMVKGQTAIYKITYKSKDRVTQKNITETGNFIIISIVTLNNV
jgi:hypothetical protein